MGASWTMYGRRSMLTAFLTPEVFVPMGTLQVALTRTVPVANASPSQLIEPKTGDYGRVSYPANAEHWAPTGFGEYRNTKKLVFPEVTISWGLIVGWALIYPAGNQCLAVGSIMNPFVAEAGVMPTLAPGVLLLGNYD
jgi:hypothetical protein